MDAADQQFALLRGSVREETLDGRSARTDRIRDGIRHLDAAALAVAEGTFGGGDRGDDAVPFARGLFPCTMRG